MNDKSPLHGLCVINEVSNIELKQMLLNGFLLRMFLSGFLFLFFPFLSKLLFGLHLSKMLIFNFLFYFLNTRLHLGLGQERGDSLLPPKRNTISVLPAEHIGLRQNLPQSFLADVILLSNIRFGEQHTVPFAQMDTLPYSCSALHLKLSIVFLLHSQSCGWLPVFQ
ncbi:MAG: hypothetical protein LUG92_05510 [Oscillospiraceae bacterium]|nr:hypothetical protein [Oscillospiraceae bacterium]